jgi:citrate lyase alpha subunit
MNETAFVSQAFDAALASLENSKAESIIPIDIRGRSSIGDYMIVASGRSHRHVTAVADHLLQALREMGCKDMRAISSSIFSVRKSVISTIWKKSGSTTISKISAHRERCTDLSASETCETVFG